MNLYYYYPLFVEYYTIPSISPFVIPSYSTMEPSDYSKLHSTGEQQSRHRRIPMKTSSALAIGHRRKLMKDIEGGNAIFEFAAISCCIVPLSSKVT